MTPDILSFGKNPWQNVWVAMNCCSGFLSVGLGIVVAVIFAQLLIIPIRKLAKEVEIIRDTTDKTQLKAEIEIRTKDEIHTLAERINEMTLGLVKAAVESRELMVGRDVQKKFLPLDTTEAGELGMSAKKETDLFTMFGYYEGASGVSGDYFDFRKLDDKHYAVIKCDVSGHGVSAALIMVRVATIFKDYFRDWTVKSKGFQLEELAYNINDQLEELNMPKYFAALILMIINMETGVCYVCNAGDNVLYIYDAPSARMIKDENLLPKSPATGPVSSDMVKESAMPFQQVKFQLPPHRTLFLFTDGIDESFRLLRDTSFKNIYCDEPGLEPNETHGVYESHKKYDPKDPDEKAHYREMFTYERIKEIVEAVYSKSSFTLIKYHNPIPDEKLTFDYSTCEDTIEDAILAVMSAEQIFRLVRGFEGADETNRVSIAKNVDAFLREHFDQYNIYFDHLAENQGADANYVIYTHLMEDPQEDDLTMFGIRRKPPGMNKQ
jgi:serine phosphatase RsbU (regulator of sigma subunit)